MEQKIFLAALAAALTLGSSAAFAQNADQHPDQPSAGYDQSAPAPEAPPSQDADHNQKVRTRQRRQSQRQHAREEQYETPNRIQPSRTFPGDLPEKTTTPGSLDREGRVLQDNRSTPAPPTPQTPQTPLDDDQKGQYK